MVNQDGTKTNKFVVQKHSRGIWSDKDIKDIKASLKKIKQLPDEEANKALRKLWLNYKIVTLKNDLGKLKVEAQKASDKGEDVSSVINKYFNKKPPKKNELAGLMNVLTNRGNAHLDLRMLLPNKKFLIGWTLNTPGAIVQFLKDGRIEDILKNKFFDKEGIDNIVTQKKAQQPLAWLYLVSSKKPTYFSEKGEVGATEETAGKFDYMDSGQFIFGAQKSDFHEYFYFFKRNPKLNGRWDIALIPGEGLEKVPKEWWKTNRPIKTQAPYITTHKYEKEKEKAKKEKIDMIWNTDTLKALKAIGYKDLPKEVSKSLDEGETFSKFVPIFKSNEEEKLVTGIVLEPETIDGQGEIISASEIRKTCFKFMQDFATLGLMHSMFPSSLKIIENYIAPVNFKIDGKEVKKGSWLITTKVLDDQIWKAVKSGELKGYSIQGISRVKEEEVEV